MTLDPTRRLALLTAALLCSGTALAQGYPTKSIRAVVPFAAGSATDQIGRAFADKISAALGQPVVIDNKPGANGMLGADIVAKAPADGYTLLVGTNSTNAALKFLMKKLPYDQDTAFAPVAYLGSVPLMVAVNKIDLPAADTTRVLSDLAGYEVLTEDLGGEVLCSKISAKEGTNLDDLLSKIMLQAEILDLRANPDRDAQGVVIEARVEKGLGVVATTLIQKGTLRVGDSFVAGEASGKVRALIGFDGKTRYKEVGPSTPVNVVGMTGVPQAGDLFVVAEDEQTAREIAASRAR